MIYIPVPVVKLLDWIETLDYTKLSLNPSDGALELLEKNPEKINWFQLSKNAHPKALELLEQNPEKIDWRLLSRNSCDKALELLKKNPNKINWVQLSMNSNPKALELIERNQKIMNEYNCLNEYNCWRCLSLNPNIFGYDYAVMETNCLIYKAELMKNRFHPRNLYKFVSWGFPGIEED